MAQVISTQSERGKDSIGEIYLAILFFVGRYPRFPKAKMIYIYESRFKSKNLYQFHHLKSCKDKNREKNITLENG